MTLEVLKRRRGGGADGRTDGGAVAVRSVATGAIGADAPNVGTGLVGPVGEDVLEDDLFFLRSGGGGGGGNDASGTTVLLLTGVRRE